MKYIGLCVGSSSVSYYTDNKAKHLSHGGNPKKILSELLEAFDDNDLTIIATGRKGKRILDLPQVSEVEATEVAYSKLKSTYGNVDAVVSAGGENFTLYRVNEKGLITGIFTGNKCASGTGEFFLQQIERMGISLDYANSVDTEKSYELSSRCSVFCKSDCTHALNKGINKDQVLNGLGKVMASKIIELAHKARAKKIMLIGGVSRNELMKKHLKTSLDIVVPDEALYFEAYGAKVWGEQNNVIQKNSGKVFKDFALSFTLHPPLSKYKDNVEFKEMNFKEAEPDDECILGIDVGSTTTKAVVVREKDDAILAGVYLRTLGDPVRAARNCYEDINNQLRNKQIKIRGLGVTGSGRKIVGLHAMTDAVYNEIMAHSRAAAYFDPEVDTIFEIGGQDAKYTYLINGVPASYAMNEACSAGTGSFLEEAARESLNIDYKEIGDYALKSTNPPNFSAQCAAFIGSDVKTAIHEGINHENICAGLIYSICLNYLNKVKGNRPVGKKIFMQGGVCYNKGVPVAMAALTDKKIIVPPHPGLMGAFGVALMVKENQKLGLIKKEKFSLDALMNREVIYKSSFVCQGGKEKCDRKCVINIIELDGKTYPFGGACNKYENVIHDLDIEPSEYNFLNKREKIIFPDEVKTKNDKDFPTIGVNPSFSMNSIFPLFYSYFKELGFHVLLPDTTAKEGWERRGAEFCFPVDISHGYMYDLLKKSPDYIFLPRIRGIKVPNSDNYNVFCPFVQSEADLLKSGFPELEEYNVIEKNIDFSFGFEEQETIFEDIAEQLGKTKAQGKKAYANALKSYKKAIKKIKELSKDFFKKLDESEFGVVLFGRSYNAFSSDANMGIPEKLATRGIPVIGLDSLPYEDEPGYRNMYWAWGEMILKAARYVENHKRLFGLYITNFSCGPDSFLTSYFRDIMGSKPSLVLELDSHTADAGLETRIEAFLDVVKSYLRIQPPAEKPYVKQPTISLERGDLSINTPDGEKLSLSDPRVKVLFPTMGEFGARALASAFEFYGAKTEVCPVPDMNIFQKGRSNSLSKECLPLQLTLGSLVNYLDDNHNEDDVILYFMPETMGPCRFGQYSVYINLWLKQNRIRNTTLLSLNSENAYAGLGTAFKLRLWLAIIISDVLLDVEHALLTLASNKNEASKAVEKAKDIILESLSKDKMQQIYTKLEEAASIISSVEKKAEYEETPKVLITGEIYVRKDEFSRKNLEGFFANNGIITHVSPVHEWIYYTDYLFLNKLTSPDSTFADRLKKRAEILVKKHVEMRIKKIFEKTSIYEAEPVDVESVIKAAKKHLHPRLTGEAIITIGTALYDIVDRYEGIISIGPFGCMPSRIAEAIIKKGVNNLKEESDGVKARVFETLGDVPIMYLEADGNPFTPTVENRLEALVVQVKRLKEFLKVTTEKQ
ncbi:MAG: 2-hydroxyglutaryl-CoA dehydratase [Kosmotoga sp.]|nr:MAG: 2-hydroxyglutaryl-CoA dehydratase [Kosmotoga sp.]